MRIKPPHAVLDKGGKHKYKKDTELALQIKCQILNRTIDLFGYEIRMSEILKTHASTENIYQIHLFVCLDNKIEFLGFFSDSPSTK